MESHGCPLRVGVIGTSYKTADLNLREEMARAVQKLQGEGALFFKHPTLVLSTCNRTELYFSAEDLREAHRDLVSFFQLFASPSIYSHFGIDCFAHLCRVTAGLDSAILAETEIQHQVKLAYTEAAKILALPGCLHYVFQKALRVGKQVRSRFIHPSSTALNEMLCSIAEDHFGSLSDVKILLVGYSEINRKLAAFLQRKGVSSFTLATRHPEKVKMEGALLRSREVLGQWRAFDWIVCATQAEGFLIEGEGGRRQLLFDLSVPRTIDPVTSGAFLWNIEQINQLIEDRRQDATESLQECESFASQEAYRFASLYQTRSKFRMTREAGERDDVADVFHASRK